MDHFIEHSQNMSKILIIDKVVIVRSKSVKFYFEMYINILGAYT